MIRLKGEGRVLVRFKELPSGGTALREAKCALSGPGIPGPGGGGGLGRG